MMKTEALRRRERRQTFMTVLFTVISVLYLMPVVLVLINSLKANAFVNTETFKLPTAESFVGLKNYIKGMTFGNFAFYKVVFYSFFITIASTALILHDIEHIVRGHLHLPQQVQDDVLTVYGLIAEAESRAHGMPVEEIHFHEVGTMDAIADVTAVCLLMNRLAPDEVVVSPIHVGSGQVRCAHGILPVPAPATAFILRDVPIYGGTVQGELCTPTGAALLRHFATRFGAMPPMRVQAIGYGMGKKDFEAANCVRAMLGESSSAGDTVTELSCNVDDMTGEAVGFALEELLAAGALEAFTVPVGMKKSRPGVMLCVLCREQDSERIAGLMLRHTTSIGVRAHSCRRYVLTRRIETVQTPYGEVRRKLSEGYGASRVKYEYDDLAHIARETGRTLDEVRSELTH